MRAQDALDLAQFDADAAHLDLIVHPPEELDLPVRQEAAQIASPVEPSLWVSREGVGDELLRRERRIVEVPLDEAMPTDVDLSRDPDWHRVQCRVEHIDVRIGDRPTDGDALERPTVADYIPGHVSCDFRSTIQVH